MDGTAKSGDGLPAAITAKQATTAFERQIAFALRYRVYVEDMGMPLSAACHASRTVIDPVDGDARVYLVWSDGQPVATARTSIGTATLDAESRAGFACDPFRECFRDAALSFSARLAIVGETRSGPVLPRLVERLYVDLLDAGVQADFLVCTPGLVRLYETIGYRRYRSAIVLPDLGYRIPMVLLLRDVAHLQRQRSPLLRIALAKGTHEAPMPDSIGLLPDSVDGPEPMAVSDDISLLRPLDVRQRRILLARAVSLVSGPGERVIVAGSAGDELFIVLAGSVELHSASGGAATMVLAGGHFGVREFLHGGLRNQEATVCAADTRLLAIGRPELNRLAAFDPLLGECLLQTLSVELLGERFNDKELP